ncbi:MAG: hypothetical protein ACOYON_02045 [Fimbriimonas sp.]
MIKKIFTLVMVLTVVGGILAGCSAPAEGEKTDATKTEPAKTEEAK